MTVADASQGSSRAPSPNKAPKIQKPPPVFLHDKDKWTEISKSCVERKINYVNALACQLGIKITVPTPSDFRKLTRFLKERNFAFHTYTLPEEAPIRVVIRRIPKEIPIDEIRADLIAQKVPVLSVHRMHKARGGQEYDMVVVECSRTESHNPIFRITSVCSLSGISIEKPYRPFVVGQCHRCQLYGHSQKNCFATPRCVKCRGDHSTKDCTRPKNPAECTEPPSCVLCDQVGHTANYKGCPRAPKLAPKMAKRAGERESRAAPASQAPPRLAPQRQSPWGKLNHQRVAPQTNQQTIPGQMDHPIPAPTPNPAPQAPAAPTTAQGRHVAPTTAVAASRPTNNPNARRSVADIIFGAYAVWMTDEARSLAAEIEKIEASGIMPNLAESQALFHRYPSITKELDSLVFINGQWVRK